MGLPLTGESINCLFEDQLFWFIDTFPSGTPFGFWTFIHNNQGVNQNTQTGIDNYVIDNKRIIKTVDLLGRETKYTNQPLLFIYNDGTVEKKLIFK